MAGQGYQFCWHSANILQGAKEQDAKAHPNARSYLMSVSVQSLKFQLWLRARHNWKVHWKVQEQISKQKQPEKATHGDHNDHCWPRLLQHKSDSLATAIYDFGCHPVGRFQQGAEGKARAILPLDQQVKSQS
jgi:hypothetical protein